MRRGGWILIGMLVLLVGCASGPVAPSATPLGTASPTPTSIAALASATPTSAPLPPSALTPTSLATATPGLSAAPLPVTTAPTAATALVGATGQVVTITAGSAVNLRAAPSADAPIVTALPDGAQAAAVTPDVTGTDGVTHWVRVTYGGQSGYVRSDLAGPPHAPVATTSAPQSTPAPSVAPTAVASDYQLAATVSNTAPTDNSRVTVTARLTRGGMGIPGAMMRTTWHYKTTTSTCDGGPSGADGAMSCTRDISRATKGFTVTIAVTVTYQSQTYRTSTGFTPR